DALVVEVADDRLAAAAPAAGGEGEAVHAEDLVDRLEPHGAAGRAVPGAAGGDALCLVAGDPRAAGVARPGAGVAAAQAGHRALRVGDRLVPAEQRAAPPAGGPPGPADRAADRRVGGTRHHHVAAGVVVHPRLGDPAAARTDPCISLAGG